MELTVQKIENYFDKFNKSYFNNSLIRNFPCKVSSSRKMGGYIRVTKSLRILAFNISKHYFFDTKDFEDIILHEMIHVYIVQNHLEDDSMHGHIFCKISKEINSKYNRNILKTLPREIQMHKDNRKIKIVVLNVGIMLFSNIDFKEIFSVIGNSKHFCKVGYVEDADIRGYKILQRKTVLNMKKYYPFTKRINETILPKCKFINNEE